MPNNKLTRKSIRNMVRRVKCCTINGVLCLVTKTKYSADMDTHTPVFTLTTLSENESSMQTCLCLKNLLGAEILQMGKVYGDFKPMDMVLVDGVRIVFYELSPLKLI